MDLFVSLHIGALRNPGDLLVPIGAETTEILGMSVTDVIHKHK
jgi:hypothetical protein